MISQNEILDAINRETARLFPDMATYRDRWPLDFERPSLLLYAEKRESTAAGPFLAEIRQIYVVQVTDVLDADGNPSVDALYEKTDRIASAFACGFLRVTDRALHIEKTTTVEDGDIGKVELTLHYFDDLDRPEETAPPAGEVRVRTEVVTHT